MGSDMDIRDLIQGKKCIHSEGVVFLGSRIIMRSMKQLVIQHEYHDSLLYKARIPIDVCDLQDLYCNYCIDFFEVMPLAIIRISVKDFLWFERDIELGLCFPLSPIHLSEFTITSPLEFIF